MATRKTADEAPAAEEKAPAPKTKKADDPATAATRAALERELAGYELTKNADRAKQVRAAIAAL